LDPLLSRGAAGRDDPDDLIRFSIAMADDQSSKHGAQTKKDESIFLLRVFGVIEQEGMLIREDRGSLLKGHAVFPLILPILSLIPIEVQICHAQMITTM
jgi:hypothetical protein